MTTVLEIAKILLPLIITSIIVIFVITRMKAKSKNGSLGKKKTQAAQVLLDSLIPLGMLFGSLASILFSIFFSTALLNTMVLGAAIGFLLGYFAYELYSATE